MHVIYLDQCVISSIAKTKDEFWVRLQGKLRRLVQQRLILCPASQSHHEESLLSEDWRQELHAVYRKLAGPCCFKSSQDIEAAQLRTAIHLYLGEPHGKEAFEAVETSSRDVPYPFDESHIAEIRRSKGEALKRMQGTAEGPRLPNMSAAR